MTLVYVYGSGECEQLGKSQNTKIDIQIFWADRFPQNLLELTVLGIQS